MNNLDKIFHLKENHTDVKTEVIAGVTTFMTMAYILAVNPSIMSAAGMDSGAIFTATALASMIATLCMAAFSNYPFVLAPGMGLNATLDAVCTMAPRRVVMISCNPATAARDVRYLADRGYQPERLSCADLFARTKHVETVVLLSKGEIDSKKVRVEFSLEDMDMSGFQKGATYEQIKAYVLEHTGLKVSSLYISQIKRKCGLDVGQNYNLSKKEDAKVPKCPPEKEAAIRDALKYFQMI